MGVNVTDRSFRCFLYYKQQNGDAFLVQSEYNLNLWPNLKLNILINEVLLKETVYLLKCRNKNLKSTDGFNPQPTYDVKTTWLLLSTSKQCNSCVN